MSRFNSYARNVEKITFETVKKIRDAEERYKKAEEASKEYPERFGMVEASYQREYLKRKLELTEAKENLTKIKEEAPKVFKAEVKELRRRLQNEVNDFFAVDASKMQPEVVSFLNSGILTINDYAKLMDVAVSEGNVSMIRLIADRTNKYADTVEDLRERANLKVIASKVDNYKPETYMTAFDSIVSVSDRCLNNPRLIDYWNTDLSIGQAVEAF